MYLEVEIPQNQSNIGLEWVSEWLKTKHQTSTYVFPGETQKKRGAANSIPS